MDSIKELSEVFYVLISQRSLEIHTLVFPDEQTSEIKGLAEQSVAALGLPVQGSF